MTAVAQSLRYLEPAPRPAEQLLPDDGGWSYARHLERYGHLPTRLRGTSLLAEIEASGLTGRGGAGFPTARKLRAVAAGRRTAIVVANGTEGEPASRKDKTLIARNPHLVLDGVLVACAAVGAEEAIVAVSRADERSRVRLWEAMRERRRETRAIRLAATPERFVVGEETALVHWLDGGSAKPTSTPPRPFERGIRGRPTLVQNVETLANLGLIARYGGDWFRSRGTDEEPGTVLATVDGGVGRPDVVEVPLGTPVAALLDGRGSPAREPQALLLGGYFGRWLDADAVDRPFSAAGLGPLGARVLAVLPKQACGVVETARVVRYLAGESAGQCGPCVFGLDALAGAAEALASCAPHAATAYARLEQLGEQIAGRGACAHPDGAGRLLASALEVFADEIEAHRRGRCTATDHEPVLPVPGPAPNRTWR
jgi:NADH:ubiquinone oxidoreductase subunit F (NADH-binding)